MSIGGAGFSIVHSGHGFPVTQWFPVAATGGSANTVLIGQIEKYTDATGVEPMGASSANTTQAVFPFGITIGVNRRTPTSNSTYSTESGTQAITQATELARDYFGAEGMWIKSDPQLLARIALIDRNTVIQGPIMKTAYGTAPGVVTVTTANSAGTTMVHGAADMTTAANNNLYYCRTGLNAGLYRGSNSTSATTPTFNVPWPYAIAVGDTFCISSVGLGTRQKINFDALDMYVDNAAAVTNYYVADVLQIDLSTAGQERVQFRLVF
jgi:hypothetical protein